MKIAHIKLVFGLTIALVAAGLPASAKETVNIKKVLRSVSAPELPAKAADLVFKTKSAEQEAVTISVVKTAIALRPASAAAVVGAIAKVAPHRAAIAASTAIALVPKQTAEINKASLLAAAQKDTIGTVIQRDVAAADGAQAPPRVGPPFVPIPQDAQEVTPGDTTPLPPGGRDYSAP